jgi:peptide chain release factor 3
MAPAPRPQKTDGREVLPEETKFSGFVFKVQANMDKNHRDRIAFVRICSGRYARGMKVLHVRSGKTIALNNPVLFLARERELAEEAFPGDIIGIPNHGNLSIGDALSEGEKLHFTGIPSFAPELFKAARLDDPMRSKQLKKALEELSQEGASQIFKPLSGSNWIIGVVGALQFDVIASRLLAEYNVRGSFEDVSYTTARWVHCADAAMLKAFTDKNMYNLAEDATGALAYLAPNDWHLTRIQEDWKGVTFAKTRENR